MSAKFVVIEENGVLEARPHEAGGFDMYKIVAGPYMSYGRAVLELMRLRKERETS